MFLVQFIILISKSDDVLYPPTVHRLVPMFSFLAFHARLGVDYNSSLSTGWYHTLFTKTDGSLWGTGRNNRGQLGDGTTTDRNSPVKIVDKDVIAVAAGTYHSLFIKSGGSLWAMGQNNYGQLGDGTTTDRTNPVQIVASGVTAVVADYHTMFLKSDGTLWVMGRNNYGQLGNGNTTSSIHACSGFDRCEHHGGWV